MKLTKFLTLCAALIAMIVLTGCYASGHQFYDAFKRSEPTTSCSVVWVHSYDAAKYRLENELPPVEFIGKSSFSTAKTYNEYAAQEDCKKAGGDYVIVVAEGVTGSKQSQITLQNNQTYTAQSSTNYYGSYGGYYGRTNTNTTYTVPTYQTYNITTTYYGYSYFVYRKVDTSTLDSRLE